MKLLTLISLLITLLFFSNCQTEEVIPRNEISILGKWEINTKSSDFLLLRMEITNTEIIFDWDIDEDGIIESNSTKKYYTTSEDGISTLWVKWDEDDDFKRWAEYFPHDVNRLLFLNLISGKTVIFKRA